MDYLRNGWRQLANRRSFLRASMGAGTAVTTGILASGGGSAFADSKGDHGEKSGRLKKGDAAILRFLAAAEILETDFWVQYNELGGIQDNQVPGGTGNPTYTA